MTTVRKLVTWKDFIDFNKEHNFSSKCTNKKKQVYTTIIPIGSLTIILEAAAPTPEPTKSLFSKPGKPKKQKNKKQKLTPEQIQHLVNLDPEQRRKYLQEITNNQ